MEKKKLRIGVSALNAVDNPGPGIPIIRCLKESSLYDVDAIGLAYDALEPGIFMENLTSASYLMPYPLTGYTNMLERLKEIQEEAHLDLIIPALDSELVAYIRMEKELKHMGVSTFLPTLSNIEMRSKANLSAFGYTHSIPVPLTRVVYNQQQLYNSVPLFTYPIVVKGVFYDASVCSSYDEVVAAFTRLARKWGTPVILQEFVQGDEYNIAAIGDGTGATTGAVISKKMYITDKGKGWSGVAIHNDELLALTRTVIHHLKWRGALELEMMRARENSHYYLLEVNPRFPAWIYLSAGVGINLPEMLVSLALGKQPEPRFDYEAGKMFLRYSAELIINMKQLESITITSSYSANGNS